jgi:hypothetical protein
MAAEARVHGSGVDGRLRCTVHLPRLRHCCIRGEEPPQFPPPADHRARGLGGGKAAYDRVPSFAASDCARALRKCIRSERAQRGRVPGPAAGLLVSMSIPRAARKSDRAGQGVLACSSQGRTILPRPFPYHNAYVLWLIRQGKATTWSTLCAHFGIDQGGTQRTMLREALRELSRAQLITADKNIHDSYDPGMDYGDVLFSVNPLTESILHTLRLSLTELAKSDLNQRLIVNPVPQRTFSTKYESDVLVFMPFSAELTPVYQDHIRKVAVKLGKSMARADDFFTNDQIINEIWTALVSTRLVIADCTHRNPNVFYETGLAHAIGKPTILITQNPDDIPFDLRHRRHLKYEFTPRGMASFEEALERTITSILAEEEPTV